MDAHTLYILMIAAGVIAILAAIVGGGLSLNVISIPTLTTRRQVLLGVFGVVLIGMGFFNMRAEAQAPGEDVTAQVEQAPPAAGAAASEATDAQAPATPAADPPANK